MKVIQEAAGHGGRGNLASEICGSGRSSLEIAVLNRLFASGYYTLRRLSCEVDGNIVRLAGRVSSYHEKQVAQTLALAQLSNEMVLANQLEVAGACAAS